MRVLITGGTGFVGSHVVRCLQSRGHQLRLLVRDADKAKRIYQKLSLDLPELLVGDITDPVAVNSALQQCDHLVHAAAATPLNSVSETSMIANNVEGTRTVFTAALHAGIQSSVYLSSVTAIFSTDAAKVGGDAPLRKSKLPYARSKIEAERIVRQLQAEGAPIAVVYPSGVIGPDDPAMSDALRALQYRINQGFRIIDDGGMQQIDVRDLARFVASLLEDNCAGRHVLAGPFLSWTQLADLIEAVSGCQLKRLPVKGWKLRFYGRMLDVARCFRQIESPISAETMCYATQWPRLKNTDKLSDFLLELHRPEDTFRDCMRWMLAEGHLDRQQVPRL